ncbi:MAG: ABC transporter substrate-binding protein [Bacillota bacterium]
MMKKRIFCALIIFCLIFMVSCAKNDQQSANNTLVDILGNQIVVDEPIQRIVSLSPAATEILYAIGADEYLLANTIYCNYPEQANNKPKIGDFSNPNMELILSYEPQLVLTASGVQENIINKFRELNIPVFSLDAYNVEDVLKNIQMAGVITGKQKQAGVVISEINDVLGEIATNVASQTENPTVFIEIWDDPLMTAGGASFISDMIVRAGGINIAADMDVEYAEFSREQLLSKDPCVYLLIGYKNQVNNLRDRAGFAALSAVKNNRVYIIEDDLLTVCGPRIVEGIQEMYKCFYPQ